MYKVLHAKDVVLLQSGLDDTVVRKRDALLVDLAVSTLVDQLAHGLQVRLAWETSMLRDLSVID